MVSYGRRDQRVVTYARHLIRWRWAVLALSLAVAGVAASGVRFLVSNGDYRYHFKADDPQLLAFNRIETTYTKMDNALFVVAPESGEVFEPEVLEAVLWLTEQAWQIPHSIRVDSLTNFQHTWSEEDDLVVEDLVEGEDTLKTNEIERVRRIALDEPLLVKRLVAPDARATAINVTVQLPDGNPGGDAVAYARDLAAQLEAKHPGLRVALTGNLLLTDALEQSVNRDLRTLIPWMYAALIVSMLLFLRSVWGTLAVLAVTALSVATAMGVAGWAGIPITAPSGMAPTIILTIAIADGVHILVTFAKDLRRGLDKADALVDSLRVNWQPVFLTSLTTVVGFLSFNFAAMASFPDLGNVTAAGVAAAWFFSITFLPAFVMIVPYRAKPARRIRSFSVERYADWVVAHRRRILPISVAASLGFASLIPLLELNDSFVHYLDERIEFRRDTDFTAERLTGIYQLHYSLEAGEPDGINEPAYLADVEAFATWYRAQPGVEHVSALPVTVKRLNKNLHGDDAGYYRLPESRELAAQYLLLYEMSLPYGLDLNNQINVKRSATKLTATLQNIPSAELRVLERRAAEWLQTHTPSMEARGAGTAMMFASMSLKNIESMVPGMAIAFAFISLLLIVELRSLRLGLVSLVPNVVPTLVAFGVWTLVVREVGVGTGLVAAASLGIIVDATVHLLSKYLRAQRELGSTPEDAVRYAISTAGPALWISFLILIVGFAVLSQSSFKINADFGLLIAISIGAALLADFLLLPTLLMRIDRSRAHDGVD